MPGRTRWAVARRVVRPGLRGVGADAPYPSYGHLAAPADTLPRLGIDVVSTLPLYATFLDEPFDPSPYAPVSRAHWSEVYLDDALPAAPTPAYGDLVDWRAVARRRRRQLLTAANGLVRTSRPRSTASSPRVPTSSTTAGSGPSTPEPADAGSPAELIGAVTSSPSTSPSGSCRRSSIPARRSGPRPADRQPPGRLRDVWATPTCSPMRSASAHRATSSSTRDRTGASRPSFRAPRAQRRCPVATLVAPAGGTRRCCASTT